MEKFFNRFTPEEESEKIFTIEEVKSVFTDILGLDLEKFETKTLVELNAPEGNYLISLSMITKEPNAEGEFIEYLYLKKGQHGTSGSSVDTVIDKLFVVKSKDSSDVITEDVTYAESVAKFINGKWKILS